MAQADRKPGERPLSGQVAVVAGATRGAGRGVACMLGAAGATVYCTGRSVRGASSPMGRPETIDETAELVGKHGGRGIAVRVDHTDEAEVAALIERIRAETGRLDVLVNDIWGGDPMMDWSAKFWQVEIATARRLLDQAVMTHLITARHAAPMMVEAGSGLIVEVTDGELAGYRGQVLYDLVKSAVIRLGYAMAWDLHGTGVTALTVTPGFLRSEAVLDHFGVSEANWRDALAKDPTFEQSETPFYVGRGIAALAADPDAGRFAGSLLTSNDLAKTYGLTDLDGRNPLFWPPLEARLVAMAGEPGPLSDEDRFIAQAAYMRMHCEPGRGEDARSLAAKLGLEGLGAGLRPLGAS